MPKLLRARAPEDTEEERKIHKLAASRHAPGDWTFRARIVSLSWDGLRTAKIAEELGGVSSVEIAGIRQRNRPSLPRLAGSQRLGFGAAQTF